MLIINTMSICVDIMISYEVYRFSVIIYDFLVFFLWYVLIVYIFSDVGVNLKVLG